MTENEIIENLDDIWTFGHEPTDEERLAVNKAIDLIQELQQYRANNIRLFGDYAYIFAGETLVTVIPVPVNLKKDFREM